LPNAHALMFGTIYGTSATTYKHGFTSLFTLVIRSSQMQ